MVIQSESNTESNQTQRLNHRLNSLLHWIGSDDFLAYVSNWELVLCFKMLKMYKKTNKKNKYTHFPLKVLIGSLSVFLGWGWRRLQEANWPEEGQASCLPSSTDRWICGQPYWACLWAQGCSGCKGEEEEEKEEKGIENTL